MIASSSLSLGGSGGSTAGTAVQWFRPTLGLVAQVQPIATRSTTPTPSSPASGNFIPGVANPLSPTLAVAGVEASKPPGDPLAASAMAADAVVGNLGELLSSASSEAAGAASVKLDQAAATPGGFPWWLLVVGYILGKAL